MHPYIKVLNQYLEDHPLHACNREPARLVDLLYCCYRQHNDADSAQIKECYHQLDSLLLGLSADDSDAVFDQVIALSDEYRQEAFRNGVAAGLRIYHELFQLP